MSSKQWHLKIFMALAGMLIGLAVMEMGLLFSGIEYPIFYDYDEFLGNKLRPGAKGYWIEEGKGYVSINQDGLRDREHQVSRPVNTLRIAVLGDSFAEALQVNQQETFWAIMEKELSGCDNLRGRKVEVINFGQSGFGTAQELLTLRHRAWKYSPDVVLLAFYIGNDISDNSRQLKRIDYHPYFVYQGDTLILDDRQTKENWRTKQHSLWQKFHLYKLHGLRIFQIANHSKDVFWKWWLCKDPGQEKFATVEGHEWGVNDGVYQEPVTGDWQEAWRVTEGLLLLMRDEVAQKGARFFVVALGTPAQVNPDPSKRAAFARALGVADLYYPDRRLEVFCQNHNIPLLTLGPYFRDYATQHKVYLHGFGKTLGKGHWNQEGHRLAGQTISQWLCPRLR